MSRTSLLKLGETMPGTDSNGNLINNERLGEIREFDSRSGSNNARRAGQPIKAVLLRNVSGTRLYGGRIGRCYKSAGQSTVTECDGYTTVLADGPCVIIDDGLATAGVADDDLFWGVLCGEVLVKSPLAGAGFNATSIAVGDALVAATGSTVAATTSGRIAAAALANATDAGGAYAQALNHIGRALSARTSGETNADVLIYANIRW